jgi:ADP-heptose:LPS heptosyltransferase
MRILALQLKRLGDLILSTPALHAIRAANPEAHIALAVAPACAPLLAAIGDVDSGIVFGRGRGFAPWQQVLTGPWDRCLDFTGTDRSALATAASRAGERLAFAWVQRSKMRALAYTRFVDSPVRERHTVDHYLDLVRAIHSGAETSPDPILKVPADARASTQTLLQNAGITGPFVIVHPGTARHEKYWLPERWAEVIARLGVPCVLTGGPEAFEGEHIAQIQRALSKPILDFSGQLDLLTLAALIERAALVLSCDTAAVHFAAAFRRPQIALFGPTNPFHWRPRHDRAVVFSAAQPGAPLREFAPRMKGASMDRISTEAVICATKALLSA